MADSNSTTERLEGEINKAFGRLTGRISVPVSEYLRELDVSPLTGYIFRNYAEPWRYRHDPTMMLRCTLFMKLKGMKFQTQLIRHLRANWPDAENLGCKTKDGPIHIPTRRAFNYFMNERITKDLWLMLGFMAEKTKEESSKRGILLDIYVPKVPKKRQSPRTFFRMKAERTHEICKVMRKDVYPRLGLDVVKNAVFKKDVYLDMLTHIGLTNDFAENGSVTFSMQRGKVPNGDTLLYHLKKYGHRSVIEGMYDRVFDMTIEMAKQSGFFDRPIEVAIDTTDIPYYGDKTDFMVVGTKEKAGTYYAHSFATINAVVGGRRLMLYAIPVEPGMTNHAVVGKLMDFIDGKIKVRRVYLDRGFFSAGVVEYFNTKGIEFLMPAVRTWRIKRVIETFGAPYIMYYRMNDASMNKREWVKLVLTEGEKTERNPSGVYAFATNAKHVYDVRLMKVHYEHRWGIETFYRVKDNFRARTTSKNYLIRLFYFMFAATLYNLWVLLNSLITKELFGRLLTKPLVTAKLFGFMLIAVVDPPPPL